MKERKEHTASSVRSGTKAKRDQRGFALVLAVVLLALVVLVLVMLAALTRVETSIAGNTRQFSQARQNALLGLNRAIAQLQAEAGPDKRVTATAASRPSFHPDKAYWTGVWDSENPSTNLGWLVSGDASSVTTAVPDDTTTVELVGSQTSNQRTLTGSSPSGQSGHIRAEKVDIKGDAPDGTTDVVLGRFAYWVGDEGVKARLTFTDPFNNGGENANLDDVPSRTRMLAPQRSGIERVNGFTAVDGNDFELNYVLAPRQLRYVDNVSSITPIKNRFHDTSVYSRGVIADSIDGGLKFDLSPYFIHGDAAASFSGFSGQDVVGGSGVTFGELRAWWKEGYGLSSFVDGGGVPTDEVAPIAPPSNPNDGAGITPIVVRWSIFAGASYFEVSPNFGEIRLHLVPVIAIWNPYNVHLAPADYRIELDWPAEFNYTVDGQNTTGGPFALPTILHFRVSDLDFAPGECRFLCVAGAGTEPTSEGWTPYDSLNGDNFLAPEWNDVTSAFYFDTGLHFDFDEDSNFAAVAHQAGLVDGLRLILGSTSGTVIQSVSGNPWSDNVQANRPNDGNLYSEPPILEPTSDTTPPTHAIVRGMVAHGGYLGPANGSQWVGIDHVDIEAKDEQSVQLPSPVDPWDPLLEAVQLQFGADDDTFRFYGYSGYGWKMPYGNPDAYCGHRYNVLFEIPREDLPLMSIGQLQNAVRKRGDFPTGALPVERIFDQVPSVERELYNRYFFSTVPDVRADGVLPNPPTATARPPIDSNNVGNPDYHLSNARIDFYKPRGNPPAVSDLRYTGGSSDPMTTAAANLMIKGAFNVNSVSVDAWTAVLSGTIDVETAPFHAAAQPTPDPVDTEDFHGNTDGDPIPGDSASPDGLFTRFAHLVLAPFTKNTSSIKKNDRNLWAGARRLTSAQITAMANSIVTSVRNQGPFASVGDFVDAGVIQTAIASAGLNNGLGDGTVGTDDHPVSGPSNIPVPGEITQHDILQVIGSILTTRSDTFIIRAYGEVNNTLRDSDGDGVGDIQGQAWCEAVVQRTPEYVDPSTPAWNLPTSGTTNDKFGRRFKVVAFRWLTPDDI